MVHRHFSQPEHHQKILGVGFDEPPLPESVKRAGLQSTDVAHLAGFLAVGLHFVNDGLPSALRYRWIAGRQVGAGDLHIERGLAVGFIFGVKQDAGFGLVLGAQAGLFAGQGVLGIKSSAPVEQDES